jgi:RimJ/RimL family protein N-acetyltransferase
MMFTSAPEIITERLRLRGLMIDDFDAFHSLRQDPEIYRHITGKPATIEDSWARLMRGVGHWQLLGFGFWAVEEASTRDFIGEAGIFDVRRDMAPSLDGKIEAGWTLKGTAQGKGYAFEAMSAVLAWGDARLGRPTYAAIITPDNDRSLKLAARLGFQERYRTTHQGDAVIVLER